MPSFDSTPPASSDQTQRPDLAWCETIAANGREHLRRLTSAGRKLSGGCDTPTLCGMTAAWDLASPVTEESLRRERVDGLYSYPCTRCVEALGMDGE